MMGRWFCIWESDYRDGHFIQTAYTPLGVWRIASKQAPWYKRPGAFCSVVKGGGA